jgi:hypothetical protein
MKTELKINLTTILVLVAGVVFFFWLNGRKNREIDLHLNTIAQHEFVYEEKVSEIDSATIAWQESLNASNESLKAALSNDSIQEELIAHYKNLSQVVKVETKYIHDTVKVSVPITVESDTTVNLSDDCFQASLSLFNGGLSLNDYTIDNRQDIVIGDQKSGFRRTESIVMIRNTNPCINTTGIQSYNVVYEKKWWENPLITGSIGIAAGFVIGEVVR